MLVNIHMCKRDRSFPHALFNLAQVQFLHMARVAPQHGSFPTLHTILSHPYWLLKYLRSFSNTRETGRYIYIYVICIYNGIYYELRIAQDKPQQQH